MSLGYEDCLAIVMTFVVHPNKLSLCSSSQCSQQGDLRFDLTMHLITSLCSHDWSLRHFCCLSGGSITENVELNLYAFPSFHLREPRKSAVPAVAFTLSLRSKSDKPLDVSFLFNVPLGQQDDTIRVGENFGEVVFTRYVQVLLEVFFSLGVSCRFFQCCSCYFAGFVFSQLDWN